MKRIYETPMMSVEEFGANQAVSTCTVDSNFEYTFDCMKGPNTDTTNCINDTIATGCSKQVGYASGYNKAVDWSVSGSHSNNNSAIATWGTLSTGTNWSKQSGITVSYSGNVDGLLYTDSGSTGTTPWSTGTVNGSDYVIHSTSSGGTHHQVAPVFNVTSVKASW